MSFLNSIWLWGGLAAAGVAVPIIIHLINRFRHRVTDWAAWELLQRAMVVRQRRVKLEDLILLLLRCLALLLIGLALARPTIRGAAAAMFGGASQIGVVVAVDGSYSMEHTGVRSRFDRAQQRVRDLMQTLDPGDPTTLVLMGQQPKVLLRNVAFDPERFASELNDAEPLPEGLNLERNLDELETLMQELQTPNRELYLVSDAQAIDWSRLSDKSEQTIENIRELGRVALVTTAAESSANVALTRFELASGTLRIGSTVRYLASAHNFGDAPVDDAAVTLEVDGALVDRRPLGRIDPGENVSMPLFVRLDRPGALRLTASLGPDNLERDNARHAVAYVRSDIRVLLVDGDPSEETFGGEVDYVRAALRPTPMAAGGESGLNVERVSWLDLGRVNFDAYDVVVLANVADLHPDRMQNLTRFVREGGGLMIFLGDKVDPAVFNARLGQEEVSLSPVTLSSRVSAETEVDDEGWAMEAATRDHRLARIIEALPRDLVEQARLRDYFQAELNPGGRALWRIAGTEQPVLAGRAFGQGRVLLFASTADRAWSDFPVFPLFPMLMHESVTWLTSPAYERQILVGEPVQAPLPESPNDGTVQVTTPSGASRGIQASDRDGRPTAEIERAEEVGFYELQYAADLPPLQMAVNLNPVESDVRPMPREQLLAGMQELGVPVISEAEPIAGAIEQSRIGRELWRWLLLAGLILLLVETYLSRRFSQRIQGGEVDRSTFAPHARPTSMAA